MINDDPYMSLRRAIRAAAAIGRPMIMYKSDVPGYRESVYFASPSHVSVVSALAIYDWKTEDRFFSLFYDYHNPILQDRVNVIFEQEINGEKDLTKLHLDLVEAGVKAPIYLRGRDPSSHINGMPFVGVSLFSDADAVMVVGLTTP